MVTISDVGRCRFRVFLPHAARVELVGTFTEWREGKVAMTRVHPGWWEVEMEIPGGEHEFCYMVDGAIMLADYAAHGVMLDGYGSWRSRLVVKGEPAVVAAA